MPPSRRAAGSSTGASQPTAKRPAAASSSSASQPTAAASSTGASRRAEVEQLVAKAKELGHFPKQLVSAEKRLYKLLLRKRDLFSEEQWKDLKMDH